MENKKRVLVACEYSGRVRDEFLRMGHHAMSCDLLPTEEPGPHYQGDVANILDGWMPVQYTGDCDPEGDGYCYNWHLPPDECFCPGPTQDDVMEYREIDGVLFARPIDHPHWDLMIGHPPCTFLTCSAEWAYGDLPIMIKGKPKNLDPAKLYGPARRKARDEAAAFFLLLANAPIAQIAIENPVGVMSTRYRKADQTIQPYEFGGDASKRTCLWLKNLPPLHKDPRNRFMGRIIEWPKGSGKFVERWGNQTDSGQSNLTPSNDRWKTRSYTYEGWAAAMASRWG